MDVLNRYALSSDSGDFDLHIRNLGWNINYISEDQFKTIFNQFKDKMNFRLTWMETDKYHEQDIILNMSYYSVEEKL